MTRHLTEVHWESRFVEQFPGDPEPRNFTRTVRGALYSRVDPTPVRQPRLLAWSDPLAADFGLSRPSAPDDAASIELLAGNTVLPAMRPYAARYGGHQFGNWAGQLGDGRAITLGEAVFPNVGRQEFQLKGPGPTPYSRRADGRAVLRSSLREFLCSEAMHFLGVPTTRALSLVSTGDAVVRDMFYDGRPEAEPGAIVCRVAPTFLRFGNFEILAASGEHELLKQLADFLIADYYPELDPNDPDVYGRLLDEVARRTALMIVEWMRVGFVHGVMNTDNMSAIGLTIDYGPYGWLESYDPDWTPNTTDAGQRRYRFGAQPDVAQWNVGRLGAALFPLIKDEPRVYRSLKLYADTFNAAYRQMFARKLGLTEAALEADPSLVADLDELLRAVETDYTIFFRRLSDWPIRKEPPRPIIEQVEPAFYAPLMDASVRQRWEDWSRRYVTLARQQPTSDVERTASMRQANPKYVLRNYLAQEAITAMAADDASVTDRLMRVLRTPYDEHPGDEVLAARRPDWARDAPGCSALSCSS